MQGKQAYIAYKVNNNTVDLKGKQFKICKLEKVNNTRYVNLKGNQYKVSKLIRKTTQGK